VTTEVGRQPWVVYRVMLTRQAVTAAKGIPVGYATLVVLLLALAAATTWILRRLARSPLPESSGSASSTSTSAPLAS
jgi:cytochrome d ubiquinol oxidase subunit I